MKMEILSPQGDRVGELIDGVYHIQKNIDHFMRIFNGFGLSLNRVMPELAANGCEFIMIRFTIPAADHPNMRYLPEFLRSRPGAVVDLKSRFDVWKGSNIIRTYEKHDPQCFVAVTEMEEIL